MSESSKGMRVEEGTVFGYSGEELRSKLSSDEEFKETFMEHYRKLVEIVKEANRSEKEAKERARADVKQEKEEAERNRLRDVIRKIQEKDNSVVLEGEEAKGDFFETSSIKYLKEWVKKYRASAKAAKEAVKEAKLAAREAKEAAKKAKAGVKHEKQIAQMEKMDGDLQKWNDKVEFEVQCFEDKLGKPDEHFSEMKAYHTRVKLIIQMTKFAETVEGVPEYNAEEIEDDDLKAMHARCKLLNQLYKLEKPLDYDTERDTCALKAYVAEVKNM
mgnify:CR=1 FL=1|tara:strand:+ start:90 stop:908 length:819 start_codon:yes stop_codon:yes gene_type:complete